MLSLIPFLLIIVVFWFFLIRPQMRKQREAQQMQSTLETGAKVMLTSGIFGTVADITDDYILVSIADSVEIKVVRAAIGRVLPEDFGQPEDIEATPSEAEDAQPGVIEENE